MASRREVDGPPVAKVERRAQAIRIAVDSALRACVYYAPSDSEGHVNYVDGDIDTADVADSIIETFEQMGMKLS